MKSSNSNSPPCRHKLALAVAIVFLTSLSGLFSFAPLTAKAVSAYTFDLSALAGDFTDFHNCDWITEPIELSADTHRTLMVKNGANITFTGTYTPKNNELYWEIAVDTGATATITLNNMRSPEGLALEDGANLTLILAEGSDNYSPIGAPQGTTLEINGTGRLTAAGGPGYAGIGGFRNSLIPEKSHGGRITINGGTIIATGGATYFDSNGAAGIGGGLGGESGIITINGGNITATGGGTVHGDLGCGAGIGGGAGGGDKDGRSSGIITINGGNITATGGGFPGGLGKGGAGIGGGSGVDGGIITINGGVITANGTWGAAIGGGTNGSGGIITINGGMITADSYSNGAGIGGGAESKLGGGIITIRGGTVYAYGGDQGAGIGTGTCNTPASGGGTAGVITISGGTVTAIGGDDSAGIGGGNGSFVHGGGNGGDVTISGGNVTAIGGKTSYNDKSYNAPGIGGGYQATGHGSLTITGGNGTVSGVTAAVATDAGKLSISSDLTVYGHDGSGYSLETDVNTLMFSHVLCDVITAQNAPDVPLTSVRWTAPLPPPLPPPIINDNYIPPDMSPFYGYEPKPETSPGDIPSDWAKAAVEKALKLKLIPADLQGKWREKLTRAEFCALAVKLYEYLDGKPIEARAHFDDTTDVNVQKLAGLGIVKGDGNGKFDPHGYFTREMALTLMYNMMVQLGYTYADAEPSFADGDKISPWAKKAIGALQKAGVVSGDGQYFNPTQVFTREMGVVTVMNFLE